MRKLAAIMFTDLVGYSALTQKNEALALELLEEHRGLLRPLFTQHNGTEIKTIGDAFLVEFASAVEAARCAVDIQKVLTAHTSVVVPERRMQVRIGIHVGDVVIEEGDVLGDGVNIASRIEPLAPPGGICVTEDVAHQIENKIDQSLELLGEKELKGIKKPVTVYRIVLPWEKEAGFMRQVRVALRKPLRARLVQAGVIVLLIAAAVGWWWTSQRVPSIRPGQITRLAVLPFVNLMNDPEQEYFVDGMHDALLTELSKLGALTVISRQSVIRYKGSDKSLGDIARELQAHALIEGSVLRAGDDVRINVQLIEAAADRHLWADIFDRKLEDVLALHSDVARAIAGEIKVKLTPEEETRLAGARPVNPEAYEAYLRGRFHAYKFSPPDLEIALQYYQSALEIEPDYALAYTGIAQVWANRMVLGVVSPIEAAREERVAALKAVELDSTLAEAYGLLAILRCWTDWDWVRAEDAFKRAIAQNPSYADAHLFYGHFLTAMKRLEEARVQMERAMELDPLNSFYRGLYGWHLCWVRRYDDALTQFNMAILAAPNFPLALSGIWLTSWIKGMYPEALKGAMGYFAALGDKEIEDALAVSYPELGYQGAMGLAADKLAARSQKAFVKPFIVAVLYAQAGDLDRAFEWLEKSFELRDHDMVYLSANANGGTFPENLINDPRFRAMLRRLNLPE